MDKKTLVEACINGDLSAKEELYRRYSPWLFSICLKWTSSVEDAQDLMHDAFIIIYSSIVNLRDYQKLNAWMASIVRNISVDFLKKRNSTLIRPDIDSSDSVEIQESLDIPPFEDIIQLIDNLPEVYGKVFRLSVLQELSHNDIARLLNISPHTSSSDLSRAKHLLRKAIKHYWMLLPLLLLILIFKNKDKSTDITVYTSPEINLPEYELYTQLHKPTPITLKENRHFYSNLGTSGSVIDSTICSFVADTSKIESSFSENEETITEDSSSYFTDFDNSLTPSIPDNNMSVTLAGTMFGPVGNETALAINDSGTYEKKEQKFSIPISLGIALNIPIYKNINLITGLDYSYLSSRTEVKNGYVYTEKGHYLGLPLGVSLSYPALRNIYVQPYAGLKIDFPLYGQSVEKTRTGEMFNVNKHRITAPFLLSSKLGIGLQYNISSQIGLYIQPEFIYYFKSFGGTAELLNNKHYNAGITVGVKFSL